MLLLSNVRYKSFLWGIVFSSLTWAVSLYLYWLLTQDDSIQNPTRRSFTPSKLSKSFNKFDSVNEVVVLPYEDNDLQRMRAKSKYYKNSNSVINQLKPKLIKPNVPLPQGLSELGLVKTIEDLKVRDEGYKLYGFNALASRNLGFHRDLPDVRHKLCDKQEYPPSSVLGSASIVICFYNEHFETLLRSVHSILDRTNHELLKEIILVDDFSDIEGSHEKVENYIKDKTFNGLVKLMRTSQREGLIRARMKGAEVATGHVLVFLDSHIEVNKQWLEPLLARIAKNRTIVVTPFIDIINADTLEYTASPIVRGGFNWGLHFKWENLQTGSLITEDDFVKPIRSPTMAGGLFAIERNYFNELGKYDPGMNIWGGENLEISFRIWMCGGSLEIIPCSRIGHVFRKRRPYTAPDGEDTMTRNSLRVAHVWMDEFKEHFFKQRPDAANVNYGDISDRIKLRERLKCNKFSWYLNNIYPELTLPGDEGYLLKEKWKDKEKQPFQPWHLRKRNYITEFQIKLTNTSLCVAPEMDIKTKGSLLILKSCLRTKNQMWYETDKSEFVLARLLCLDAGDRQPKLSKCHEMGGSQDWRHRGMKQTPIYSMAAGTCLGVEGRTINSYVTMEICKNELQNQWDLVLSDISTR
ncbi:polypeptide N-acetylgalactosaminyltransferase 35A-like [Lycorma delicatula]|uniref:polypeptide N-acetylgalactosaminyltransferase 35A-like n=1 Tax=Lycorma delicatula TaxID=130591 RepID=UPI003F511031